MRETRYFAGGAWLAAAALAAVIWTWGPAQSAPVSDVRATKHNFTNTAPSSGRGLASGRTIVTATVTEVCVFCHTPHGAAAQDASQTPAWRPPLWNRTFQSNPSYTLYTSTSLDAVTSNPVGSSKLCLSCHDGAIAIGTVINKPGSGLGTTSALGGLTGKMPAGQGTTTGFTRSLGEGTSTVDLTNDHPISFTYNSTLATNDGELRPVDASTQKWPASGTLIIGPRAQGSTDRPKAPLEAGQVQCGSCHDPHIIETNTNLGTTNKFLRLNRFQGTSNTATGNTPDPANASFNPDVDISCLACHAKAGWGNSVHANSNTATATYRTDVTLNGDTGRQFILSNNTGLPVWRVACLNCHDTHTVKGARRLLREGTDNTSSPKAGGNPAIEETCYQCHNTSTASVVTPSPPDIKTEFARATHMPINDTDQRGSGEKHEMRNGDLLECRNNLGSTTGSEVDSVLTSKCPSGSGSNDYRHVECTDCHNPHRVMRASVFHGDTSGTTTMTDAADPGKDIIKASTTARTHIPPGSTGGTGTTLKGRDGNIASGVLRGMWGVEPTWGVASGWPNKPSGYTVKKGEPPASSTTMVARGSSWLTREYQLCFKCHSDYAFADNGTYTTGGTGSGRPALGSASGSGGGTTSTNPAANANNTMAFYTNVAAEFNVNATDPPSTSTDQGESTNNGTSICTNYGADCVPQGSYPGDIAAGGTYAKANSVNHRSWHPAVWPTGRNRAERSMTATDNPTYANFKVPFNANIGTQTMHCSDCHGADGSWTAGTGPSTAVQGPHGSGNKFILKSANKWELSSSVSLSSTSTTFCANCHFPQSPGSNLSSGFPTGHIASGSSKMNTLYCMRCHIAVPHGWRNKAFLVNLLCVGKEGGQASDCATVGSMNDSNYTEESMSPYYVNSRLRVSTWAKSGSWGKSNCGGTYMSSRCNVTEN